MNNIINEAEDFEIWDGYERIGRYMVNSQEPYELNIVEIINRFGGDPVLAINYLLKTEMIVEYEPDYKVHVSLFGNVEITKGKK